MKDSLGQYWKPRGALCSIVEEIMLDVMYEAPSRQDLEKVVVTKDLVERRSSAALLVTEGSEKKQEKTA